MQALSFPTTFPIKNNMFLHEDTLGEVEFDKIIMAQPMKVGTYAEMMDMVSLLAWYNRKYILFFRGQTQEFHLGGKNPTIYPTYFRKYLEGENIKSLSQELENFQKLLQEKDRDRTLRSRISNVKDEKVTWSLLQHYNICETPLVDITQSKHVAASFALNHKQENEEHRTGIIYVIALPWPSKNFHNNKEEDIYLVRLAGITPPEAKRPYRQEAFAVMSRDVDIKQTHNMNRYDLARRLVCKFEINNSRTFWGETLNPLEESFMIPRNDIFYEFMKSNVSYS